MELNDPNFQHFLKLIEDYSDLIWKDELLRNTLMFYTGRAIKDKIDMSDEEIRHFEKHLKEKIEAFVKISGN